MTTRGRRAAASAARRWRIRPLGRHGGRWGSDAVRDTLTRTTYIGRHRFNTKFWKTREHKPQAEIVEMALPPIIEVAEFEAVQALLKSRSPAWTAPRIVSGSTLFTAICFCAARGMAMTLRAGKGGRHRYYTCSTKTPGRDRPQGQYCPHGKARYFGGRSRRATPVTAEPP